MKIVDQMRRHKGKKELLIGNRKVAKLICLVIKMRIICRFAELNAC